MVGPPNNHDLTTKISTINYFETDSAFENYDIFLPKYEEIYAVFGPFSCFQGKTTVQALLSGKWVVFNQKSGKIMLGTAENPVINSKKTHSYSIRVYTLES